MSQRWLLFLFRFFSLWQRAFIHANIHQFTKGRAWTNGKTWMNLSMVKNVKHDGNEYNDFQSIFDKNRDENDPMKIDGRWSFHSTGFMKHLMLWRFQIQFFLFDTIDQARIKHQWNGKWLESYTLSTLEMMREYKVKIKKFYHTWPKSWICEYSHDSLQYILDKAKSVTSRYRYCSIRYTKLLEAHCTKCQKHLSSLL